MAQSTIALVILGATIVLFLIDSVPIFISALLAAFAMAATGIIGFNEVFSPMSSNTILVLIGMMIVGRALAECGIVDVLASFIRRTVKGSERSVLVKLCVFIAVVAGLTNAIVALSAMLPVIDHLCAKSNGEMDRRRMYMPVAVASAYGCTLTAIGASSMLHLSAILEATPSVGRALSFFEPATVGLPAVILLFVYTATVGYSISKKAFTFEEVPPADANEKPLAEQTPEQRRRMHLTVVIFLVAIALLLFSSIPSGIVAMGAAVLLILARCTTPKVLSQVSWGTIFLVVGSVSMGEGIDRSGAGVVITEAIVGLLGPMAESPFAMCCLMLFVAAAISNFMANNAALTITAPIALSMATTLGYNPIPFGLACAVGSLISCSTPVCNANVAMSTPVGYRFRDYFVWGGSNNVLAFLGCSAALYVVYFM